MGAPKKTSLIPAERIKRSILLIRGQKVILDKALAVLYGVSTGNLNKAVSRNLDRFPSDFMFQLTRQELGDLKFQFGTSSWGGTRKLPRAFTEQAKPAEATEGEVGKHVGPRSRGEGGNALYSPHKKKCHCEPKRSGFSREKTRHF